MRTLALILLLATCAAVAAQEPLPYDASQPGFHDANLELAQYCLDNNLISECKRQCGIAAGQARAAELLKACEGKSDAYTAAAWGGFLDRRELVQKRRALGAAADGHDAQSVLYIDPDHAASRNARGQIWHAALGWLDKADHERLAPLVSAEPAANAKAPHEASWDKPFVVAGKRFTLVTDLPWSRALKYSALLERFGTYYTELVGDVIPARATPNVVWCCKQAQTYVSFTTALGFAQSATSGGLHIGALGLVVVNAERCDEVGRKNKSRDNLARTLFHECAHRLTESGLRGRTPNMWDLAMTTEHAWVVESIAVVFEDLYFDGQKAVHKGLEDQRKYTIDKFWKAKGSKVPGLAAVFDQGAQDFGGDKPVSTVEKYAMVGSVGWYCLFDRKDKFRAAYLGLIVDYYRADTKGRNFEARFGVKLADFETEWQGWVVK